MGATTLCLHMCVMTATRWVCNVSCTDEKSEWSSSGSPSQRNAATTAGAGAMRSISTTVPGAARLQKLVRCTPPQALERVTTSAGATLLTADAEEITPPRELAQRRLQERKLRNPHLAMVRCAPPLAAPSDTVCQQLHLAAKQLDNRRMPLLPLKDFLAITDHSNCLKCRPPT